MAYCALLGEIGGHGKVLYVNTFLREFGRPAHGCYIVFFDISWTGQ